MVKYAILVFVFILVVGGAYRAGYSVGSSDTKVEYVTKEVVRYVEIDKEKAAIYSTANISRDTALRMYSDNKF